MPVSISVQKRTLLHNVQRRLQSRRPAGSIFSTCALLLAVTSSSSSVAAMSTHTGRKVIDSHLHVWANSLEAANGFPYVDQDPPASLQNLASTEELVKRMEDAKVDGTLIVQPINHKFDHSYVLKAMKLHPAKFKGMYLHDPSLSAEEAVTKLEDFALQGFVGVRFNPYLWPKIGDASWSPMSEGAGLAVYKRCAELNMPVGIMCFQGLDKHYDDILHLIAASPDTCLILDHFGFTGLDEAGNAAFADLLKLAKFPNVIIKISAVFRLKDEFPFERVKEERFLPLLQTFGADRLMFGTDFPYVLEQHPDGYQGIVQLMASWIPENDRDQIMGGTAERIFGHWGEPVAKPKDEEL